MIFAGIVYTDKVFIIQGDCSHLVKGRGEKLYHIVPMTAVIFVINKLLPFTFQISYERIKSRKCVICHAIVAEIIAFKRLRMYFVHS